MSPVDRQTSFIKTIGLYPEEMLEFPFLTSRQVDHTHLLSVNRKAWSITGFLRKNRVFFFVSSRKYGNMEIFMYSY
jgi:hypothetical protein